MGPKKSKPKPPPPPPPPASSPLSLFGGLFPFMGLGGIFLGDICKRKGNKFCKTKSNAKGCQVVSKEAFKCTCANGYRQQNQSFSSECVVIDKCLSNNGGCDSHATCTNRIGKSPTCECKAPYWEDSGNGSPGTNCKEVDFCGRDHGGCDKHANCIARKGRQPLCKCMEGYKGGSNPGDKCEDVDECLDTKDPPCGTKGQHAICKNTPGSYTCSCEKGYKGSGQKGDCEQIQYCEDKSLNDCDTTFATCALKEGSYKCTCLDGLEGDGTVGNCRVGEGGDMNRYCEILGKPCTAYQECRSTSVTDGLRFECVTKSKTKQLSTFLHQGPSKETPPWVWGVVGVGSFILLLVVGFLIYWLVKWYKRRSAADEFSEEALLANPVPGYDAMAHAATYQGGVAITA